MAAPAELEAGPILPLFVGWHMQEDEEHMLWKCVVWRTVQ